MSAARESFYDTTTTIVDLTSHRLLTDVHPLSDPHNNRARILRNGLVVSAFSHLESYLEERFAEAIQGLSSSSIAYAAFNNRLRQLFSVSAVQGLGNRANFMEKSDALAYVELHLPRLASFAAVPPSFTEFGFNYKGSNLWTNDISDLLGAFGISKSWTKLGTICTHIGASRLDLQEDFRNLIRIRNRAAHNCTTNVPTNDLISYVQTANLIGLCVDIAITHAIECYKTCSTYSRAATAADRLSVNIRFLDQDPNGTWRELSRAATKTIRLHSDLNNALSSPTRPIEGFVVRDTRSFPIRIL